MRRSHGLLCLVACPPRTEDADPTRAHRTVTSPAANQERIGSKQPDLTPRASFFPTSHHQKKGKEKKTCDSICGKPETAIAVALSTGLRAVSACPRRPCPGASRNANLLVTNAYANATAHVLAIKGITLHGPISDDMISRLAACRRYFVHLLFVIN